MAPTPTSYGSFCLWLGGLGFDCNFVHLDSTPTARTKPSYLEVIELRRRSGSQKRFSPNKGNFMTDDALSIPHIIDACSHEMASVDLRLVGLRRHRRRSQCAVCEQSTFRWNSKLPQQEVRGSFLCCVGRELMLSNLQCL
jgi:hypothetical protein